MNRYSHLTERVLLLQPKTILEVGTWRGVRARELLRACPTANYYGFDLFEDATCETDAAEMNVKPHATVAEVEALLQGYNVTLVRGNTRRTLPAWDAPEPIEFAWIDGGHSVDTIASDWAAVQRALAPDAEVWFDDYYTGGPDTRAWGCNRIVEGLRHQVHPVRDRVADGGWTQMVRVWP